MHGLDPNLGFGFVKSCSARDLNAVAQGKQFGISTASVRISCQCRGVPARQNHRCTKPVAEFCLKRRAGFGNVADLQISGRDGNQDMPHLLRLQICIIAQAQDGLQRGMGAMTAGMKLVQHGLKFPNLAKPLERISRGVCLCAMGRRKALVAFQCVRSCQESGLGK